MKELWIKNAVKLKSILPWGHTSYHSKEDMFWLNLHKLLHCRNFNNKAQTCPHEADAHTSEYMNKLKALKICFLHCFICSRAPYDLLKLKPTDYFTYRNNGMWDISLHKSNRLKIGKQFRCKVQGVLLSTLLGCKHLIFAIDNSGLKVCALSRLGLAWNSPTWNIKTKDNQLCQNISGCLKLKASSHKKHWDGKEKKTRGFSIFVVSGVTQIQQNHTHIVPIKMIINLCEGRFVDVVYFLNLNHK